jgi:hypothetical protein
MSDKKIDTKNIPIIELNGTGFEIDYFNMLDKYKSEKQKTIAYEQTFNIVMNDLKLINEMATKNLPNDIYKVVVEYLIKEIEQTLQKHIDK